MDLSAPRNRIRALSIDERIRLVQEIWDDLAEDAEQSDLSEEEKATPDRRLAAYEANPENVTPWEEVKARIEKRLGR